MSQAVKGNKLPIFRGHDYTGEKIGRWLVLGQSRCERYPTGRNYRTKWLCRCDCGTEKWITKESLTKGKSKGCYSCSVENSFGENNPNWKGDGVVSGSYWYRMIHSAEYRNIEVSVSIENLNEIWTGYCVLTGWPISTEDGTASLDRIDSDAGYVPGNIQWVHKDVNMMKNHFPESRFIEVCQAVNVHLTKP